MATGIVNVTTTKEKYKGDIMDEQELVDEIQKKVAELNSLISKAEGMDIIIDIAQHKSYTMSNRQNSWLHLSATKSLIKHVVAFTGSY